MQSQHTKEIQWRIIPDFPDCEISEYGAIKKVVSRRGRKTGRIIRPYKANGYLRISVRDNEIGKNKFVHDLVAQAFIGAKPTPKHQIAHWDGVRDNNHVSNLRWVTAKENYVDKIRHGKSHNGLGNPRCKLTEEQVLAIRAEMSLPALQRRPDKEIELSYGITNAPLYQIKNKKSWAHL